MTVRDTHYGAALWKAMAVTLALVLVCFGAFYTPHYAYADTEYDNAVAELDRITSAYASIAAEQDATLSQLEDLRSQMRDNENQISDVRQEISDCQATLADKRVLLANHVAANYKSGGVSLLSILVSSESFEEAVSRMYYFSSVANQQANEIDEINSMSQQLEEHQSELETLQNNLEQQEADLEELYETQQAQSEEMYEQQVAAAAFLDSLTAAQQEQLRDSDDELIAGAEAIAQEATAQGATATQQTTTQDQQTESTTQQSQQSTQDTSASQNAQQTTQETTTTTDTTNTSEQTPAEQSTPSPAPSYSSMQAVLDAAYSTSGDEAKSKGWGCAGWVYTVFRNSGVYDRKPTCAAWYYNNWCYTSDRSQLQPGMVVSVSTWTGTSAGRIYGHVGIYVGNNTVRHLSAGAIRNMSLDDWIRRYGTTVTPRWGWNGGIPLS